MNKIIQNLLTARDNESFSMVKLIALATVVAMLINFLRVQSVDFTGLGIGVTGVISAMAVKYHVEKEEK